MRDGGEGGIGYFWWTVMVFGGDRDNGFKHHGALLVTRNTSSLLVHHFLP